MMKPFRTLKKLLFVFVCCLLCACGKKAEENPSTAPEKETGNAFSQKIEAGGQFGDALPLIGKAFGELPVVGEEDAVYCNLPENVQSWEDVVPLCLDPLYGILYYVDYGGDNMIHAVYNGESVRAVELPAKRLFCREGKLYFLLEAYNRFRFEGAESGNIAEYDPVTGKVKVLTDQSFTSMVVYRDIIYCRCEEEPEDLGEGLHVAVTSEWFYFFDTDKLEEAEKTGREYSRDFRRYGEYFLAATLQKSEEDPRFDMRVGMELRKWDGERGVVWDGFQPPRRYYVKEGKFRWLDSEGFHFYDPVSGQDEVKPWISENSDYNCTAYILVGDLLFLNNSQLIYTEEGNAEKWSSQDEKLNLIHELYTDGDEIYAIVGPIASQADKNSVLRRVKVTEGKEGDELQFEEL